MLPRRHCTLRISQIHMRQPPKLNIESIGANYANDPLTAQSLPCAERQNLIRSGRLLDLLGGDVQRRQAGSRLQAANKSSALSVDISSGYGHRTEHVHKDRQMARPVFDGRHRLLERQNAIADECQSKGENRVGSSSLQPVGGVPSLHNRAGGCWVPWSGCWAHTPISCQPHRQQQPASAAQCRRGTSPSKSRTQDCENCPFQRPDST